MSATASHFDIAIVGGGPSGATAAALCASAGARVALIDKAVFPRDKACGDMVGPRALALANALALVLPSNRRVITDMMLVGPRGKSLKLLATSGETYPGSGWLIPRRDFDLALFNNAVDRGANPIFERVSAISMQGPTYVLSMGENTRISADSLIGADGATSIVARDLSLIDESKSLWGFAVRSYIQSQVDIPIISLFRQRDGLFPGYGWMFADLDGTANVGVGIGLGSDRKIASAATRALPNYLQLLVKQGWLEAKTIRNPAKPLGGWLRMGALGVNPGLRRALLVGDAAALVNPLQGEGIFAAMDSGAAAAQALLSNHGDPAVKYKAYLRANYLTFASSTAALHRFALQHRLLAQLGASVLTSKFMPRVAGSAWGIYWNDLIEGAGPVKGSNLARIFGKTLEIATLNSPERKALESALS